MSPKSFFERSHPAKPSVAFIQKREWKAANTELSRGSFVDGQLQVSSVRDGSKGARHLANFITSSTP